MKTTVRMGVLHRQTVLGVLKELTVLALVYNLVRLVMGQSAALQSIGVERISFLDALRWFYPLEALMVAAILAVLPYLLIRGPLNRVVRRWHRGAGGCRCQVPGLRTVATDLEWSGY